MNATKRLLTNITLAMALAMVGPVQAALAADSAAPAAAADGPIAAALANPARPAADREQDAVRKPADVLGMIGVEPGMHVLDAFSAGGYYTELLSSLVGAKGEVVAFNNPPYANFAAKGIAARYADNRLPNVRQVTAEVDELELAPRSLDAAIFVMSYHDMYWRPADGSWARTDPMQMLRKLHAAMKVGGVVVVQDHVAAPGGDVAEVVDKLHRIDPAIVKRDFEAAGFALEAQSDALAHPDDDHTLGVFDPKIRGRTDQFVMKFRRPGP
jgi:predicted methyltransferase